MSEPFIAEVKMYACNFAPRGWSFCNGQLLPIAQNTALFSLLGTTYGGDGRTTVGLPNLTDRIPMHPGFGPGLTTRTIGQQFGSETVTLTEPEVPSHNHIVRGVAEGGSSSSPDSNLLMGIDNVKRREKTLYMSTGNTINTSLSSSALNSNGGSQTHNNSQPFLGVNFCIALTGLYPSRS